MKMKRIVTVSGKLDIRSIICFAEIARSFSAHIMICHDNSTVNGKGLLGLVSLFSELKAEDRLVLTASGPDSEQALEQLSHFFHPVPNRTEIPSTELSG